MRRRFASLIFLLPWMVSAAAYADPLFDFKLTGDGHTYEFQAPNPRDVYDAPPPAIWSAAGGSGTADGVSGYGFIVEVAVRHAGGFPYTVIDVQPPDAPGFSYYFIRGGSLISVTSIPVNYNPTWDYFGYETLFVSTFVPGDYRFSAPLHLNLVPFDLSISEVDQTTVTPEPSTWVLLATGVAGGIAALRKRCLLLRAASQG